MKPYSEASEQNKEPILAVLREAFAGVGQVLEIGSGTGQHAAYFPRHLTHLTWHASDVELHHSGIRLWLDEAALPNVRGPIALDVTHPWPDLRVGGVFSANTAHIMDWPTVEAMFRGIGQVLDEGGVFCLYGPFNYGGCYTSESNTRFDQWLKQRDPNSGIRDFEALDVLARAQGMTLAADHAMPANNHTLVWCKGG